MIINLNFYLISYERSNRNNKKKKKKKNKKMRKIIQEMENGEICKQKFLVYKTNNEKNKKNMWRRAKATRQ